VIGLLRLSDHRITQSPDYLILHACHLAFIPRKSAANFGGGSATLCSLGEIWLLILILLLITPLTNLPNYQISAVTCHLSPVT
jgi:hypothetical protein